MTFAADQVARLGRTVSAPASVRSSGVEPEVRFGSLDDVDDLLRAARDSVGAAGTVVAIVPEAAARPDDDSVLTATEAKGLERSEEHTSELQSLMRTSYAVICLKKKNKTPH